MLTVEEVQKMKVIELRAELMARNLDVKGVKAVLVERLLDAFETEGKSAPVPEPTLPVQPLNLTPTQIREGSPVASNTTPLPLTPSRATRSSINDSPPKPVIVPSPVSSPTRSVPAPVVKVTSPVKADTNNVSIPATSPIAVKPGPVSPIKPAAVPQPVVPVQAIPVAAPAVASVPKPEPVVVSTPQQATLPQAGSPAKPTSAIPEAVPVVDNGVPAPVVPATEAEVPADDVPAAEPMETEEVSEEKKRKAEAMNGNQKDGGRKPKKFKAEERKVRVVVENEPDFDGKGVVLDWYKSDLNLRISENDFLKAEQIVFEEFPWAYAGVKATHGFKGGKICFEVKWVGSKEIKSDMGSNVAKHVVRVGWSDLFSDLQLGEDKISYAYDSCGKIFINNEESKDAVDPFCKDDVITTYLDLESDPVVIKFARNGSLVGSSIKIPKADLEGKILFPHILVRNTNFEANFGESEPAFPLLEDYQMVGKVSEADDIKVRGPEKASAKGDCEFIMLCGMACSGKTRWAKEKKLSSPDQHFNILGTSTVVERVVRDIAVAGLLMKAGKFVEKLVDMAPSRRRNYILDQSNVLPSVQRRKAGGFDGFKRRAVVILPSDEEYQSRIKSREQEQGKSVPKSTLLDMKGGFKLPEAGDLFTEVEFPELEKDAATELIVTYNKEGAAAGYGQRPLTVRGGQNRRGGRGMQRGGRGHFRGDSRGGRGVWRGGPPRGGPPPPFRGGLPPRGFRGGARFPMPIPSIDRVAREPNRGFGRGGGGPPRGIPSLAGVRRGGGGGGPPRGIMPRGNQGVSPWNRGGGSMNGNQARPLFPRGRGSPMARGGGGRGGGAPNLPFNNGSNWNSPSPSGGSGFGQGRFGGSPAGGGYGGGQQRFNNPSGFQNQGNRASQGGGGGGGFQNQNWSQASSQIWERGNAGNNVFDSFGGGGGNLAGGNQFADPWAQQVPDQGYGQSWDNSGSAANMGGNNRGSGGGGTWQSFGGQTYGGNFNSGGYGRK